MEHKLQPVFTLISWVKTTKKNVQTVLDPSKDTSFEMNTEKTNICS
jgi:hypothetical protein